MKRREILYKKVRDEIREILANHDKSDAPLPTEKEICQLFKISRGTVRKAFEELEHDKLIQRIPGKGTFAASPALSADHNFSRKELVIIFIPKAEDLERDPLSTFVFFDMLRGVARGCEIFGYQTHIIEKLPGFSQLSFDAYINEVKKNSAKGVIFLGYSKDDEFTCTHFEKNSIPSVIAMGHFRNIKVNFVAPDTQNGVKNAVNKLIALGHRKIAFISGPLDLLTFQLRLNGYRDALDANGIDFSRDMLIECIDGSAESAKMATKTLLAARKDITAIFSANDMRALGAMQAIKEQGLKIPDDISIIGFDNIKESTLSEPPLTTVDHPRFDLGFKTVELLNKIILKEISTPACQLLETNLIERASCSICKTSPDPIIQK
ncbi:MAG: hypothetical protein A2017_08270 [Lentisphaerae bacterium GWF2_44_16]|nr:MAG: hypothetical protein A2017_08270 [Lentisphaerae bacterium GWF2_44_16]